MDKDIMERLVVQHTKTLNALLFQLIATRQALDALLTVQPAQAEIAATFRQMVEQTISELQDEPEQDYLLESYLASVRETLGTLGHPLDDA